MPNKMLIDATHPEETRVVVLRGNRVEEFDFESANRKQLRGNIYLAKVTRVEPSLQAAFVDYGGNRHGFLAFSEIHPDYYQIPKADREALLREEAEHAAEEERLRSVELDDDESTEDRDRGEDEYDHPDEDADANGDDQAIEAGTESDRSPVDESAADELRKKRQNLRRRYKIQDVIQRRQVLLVQVVKEERGNKGAALTTYLSLAGRYCVLMPNTARGGGISRKITDAGDRRRLKDVARDIEVAEGMGLIVRTAGAQRTKTEIKRDFDYLMRLWESVRDLTLSSTAPALVYEEGNLIKRAIRDLYTKDVEEIFVEGEDAYREAKDFMKMLMPSHARNVKLYKDTRPLFSRYQVETQLDSLFSHTVTLPSGGYMVINQTEALVSIDINSGRSTREHNIEDTALRTNLEASDEIARQLRLRDLAGLIVIDFIDMEEKRNNRAVERRLKEALKHDRARIQVGRISHFGLMEMSRQRIRSSVLESSTEKCPHCGGMGHVRSVGSVALQLLRSLEEMLIKGATHNLTVHTRADVALYVLNHKRAHLRELETRFRITIAVNADPAIVGQQPFVIERGEQVHSVEAAKAIAAQLPSVPIEIEEEDDEEETIEEDPAEVRIGAEPEPESKHRRRRRRRRGGEERQPAEFVPDTDAEHTVVDAEDHES